MLSFKQYLKETASVGSYVVVRNNRVELRRMNVSGPVATFASGATTAVLQGNVIVVTMQNGKVVLYKVNAAGNAVSGPFQR